jgi:hypothetical protein
VLSVSGPGVLYRAVAYNNQVATRALGLKIILDGVTIFSYYEAGSLAQYEGVIGVGTYYGNQAVSFESSCDIQIKTDTAETDFITIGVLYATV